MMGSGKMMDPSKMIHDATHNTDMETMMGGKPSSGTKPDKRLKANKTKKTKKGKKGKLSPFLKS